jgi:hypothetical protein
VTAFPALSPFTHAVAGGWAMIVVGHFWTLASAERSPLRAGMQALGGIDDDVWHQIRTGWGYVVLCATQLPVFLALAAGADSLMLAPLLAGSATVVVHHGLRRHSRLYLLAAGAELLLALHFDFLVPSLIPKRWVAWILLAIWTALLAVRRLPRQAAYATAADRKRSTLRSKAPLSCPVSTAFRSRSKTLPERARIEGSAWAAFQSISSRASMIGRCGFATRTATWLSTTAETTSSGFESSRMRDPTSDVILSIRRARI